MTLIVATAEGADEAALRADVERVARELRLEAATVSAVADTDPAEPVVPTHIVTVYGTDHPGIVNAVATALAGLEVNITDLNTRLVGDGEGQDLYAMMLEIALPPGLDSDALEGLLSATRREQGVEVTVREVGEEP